MKRPVLLAAAALLVLGARTPGTSGDDGEGIAPAGQEATGTVDSGTSSPTARRRPSKPAAERLLRTWSRP